MSWWSRRGVELDFGGYPVWGTFKGDRGHRCSDCGTRIHTLTDGVRTRVPQHSGVDGKPCVDARGVRLRDASLGRRK